MSAVVKVVQPTGILDGVGSNHLRQHIQKVAEEGADIVLLDLQDVTFMDSSGLGVLVITLKSLRAAGKRLFICSVNEQVKMLFELTSMNRIFAVFQDRDEFTKVVLTNR